MCIICTTRWLLLCPTLLSAPLPSQQDALQLDSKGGDDGEGGVSGELGSDDLEFLTQLDAGG